MQDLSLHILDLVQNSIAAKADLVQITIVEDRKQDRLTVEIDDNGVGMDPQVAQKVTDPFYTTRTTRKVGLGLPLFKSAAESCDGTLTISSLPGRGTCIKASFRLSHIDRPPMGKLEDTMATLILCNPRVDFVYSHFTDEGSFNLDTREIRKEIGCLPIDNPEVIEWIRSYIVDGLNEINGGVEE